MSAESTLLEVRDLHVAYRNVEAVHGVSLRVGEGSIVSVIGPNGAGKTTLLSAVMGLLPSRGIMACFGQDARTLSVEQRVKRGAVRRMWSATNMHVIADAFAPCGVVDDTAQPRYESRRDIEQILQRAVRALAHASTDSAFA